MLALILKGRVRCDVPGLDLSGEPPDLHQIDAQAQGFLLNAVALPLELTQLVPFGSSARCGTGTTATAK